MQRAAVRLWTGHDGGSGTSPTLRGRSASGRPAASGTARLRTVRTTSWRSSAAMSWPDRRSVLCRAIASLSSNQAGAAARSAAGAESEPTAAASWLACVLQHSLQGQVAGVLGVPRVLVPRQPPASRRPAPPPARPAPSEPPVGARTCPGLASAVTCASSGRRPGARTPSRARRSSASSVPRAGGDLFGASGQPRAGELRALEQGLARLDSDTSS